MCLLLFVVGGGVEDDLQIKQKKKTMEIRGGGSEVQI
jgi:hypothetical protein